MAGWSGAVPYVDVVIDVRGASYEKVRATTASALASSLPNVGVTLVGPWLDLTTERRSPLDDPLLDLRLIQGAFAYDRRVGFTESLPETSTPAPFRFRCPAGLALTADALRRLVELADKERVGLLLLAFPKGLELLIARLERTEAVAHAVALRDPDEDLVEVVHELFGSQWIDGAEWALVSAAKARTSASKADAAKWQVQEAARLKTKEFGPLGERLLHAASRRVSRIIPGNDRAKKDG
jgi:hypothetical protein